MVSASENKQGGAGGQGGAPVVRFSTAGLPHPERFEGWRQMVSALFDVRRLGRHGDSGFSAALTAYHFGGFLLCHSRSDAARYDRSVQRSRLDDLDHYLIHMPLQQQGVFGSDSGQGPDRFRRLRPMDVGLFDMAMPASLLSGAGEAISLVVPRATLAALLKHPNHQHGRVLGWDTPMGAILGRHLIGLYMEASRFGLHETSVLADAAIRLIALAFGFDAAGDARGGKPPGTMGRETLARRVRLHIEQNLHRESLTPETIMKELVISRSQLYRQFERYGGVHRYLRQRRLRQCLISICNPLHAGERIADIAYNRGFSDEAHFSRIFREAYGMSPREARNAAQRGDGAVLAALIPPARAGVEAADASGDATGPLTHWVRELMTG